MSIIRLLATSDVHGYVFPHDYATNAEKPLGLAKLASVIASRRDENTILIDNGDSLEGSPLSFFHQHIEPDRPDPVTLAFRRLHYDCVNVGNHDFNYGWDVLNRHLQQLGSVCITGNVEKDGVPIGQRYRLFHKAGKTVALFGCTTSVTALQESPEHIRGITFPDACAYAKETVEYLRTEVHPDYIVCVYHGGLERDPLTNLPTEKETGENEGSRILQETGADVLISGHQHRSLALRIGRAAVTQTADEGKELACIEIDTETGVITPSLLPADAPAEEEMLAEIQAAEDRCQAWLDQPLGETETDLTIPDEEDARLHKAQLITFLNRVMTDVSGAELAASALFSHAAGFPRFITMRHLISTYIYPNTVVVKKVTGRILKDYLEQDASYFTVQDGRITVSPDYLEPVPQPFNYDMVDGVDYTIKASNPRGRKITSLTRAGQPVQDQDVFTLAISSYRAAGGGGFAMLKEAPTVREIPASMVEILARYILEHKVIAFAPVHNITVIE